MTDKVPFDQLISFARYLSWADLQHTLLKEEMYNDQTSDHDARRNHEWRWFGVMCYWYASVYVVVEAWDDLGFSDPVVDCLLSDLRDLRGLLRRYRNGVFHYQAHLLSPKVLQLLQVGSAHAYWVLALHIEIIRFFADYLSNLVVTDEQRAETRDAIEDIVNWYPYPEATAVETLERTLARARQMLAQRPDDVSEARRQVELALEDGVRILEEGHRNWATLRAEILRKASFE